MAIVGFLRNARIILTATFGADVVAEVTDSELPTEILRTVKLRSDPVLQLLDSAGQAFRYDLSSAVAEGAEYAHFSIRVSQRFAVEADCLLSTTADVPAEEFRRGHAKGIRLQPFYLPECAADPRQLIGRSLFFRGFHFPGTITPGNVSLLCICDQCRTSFRLQSFHAGFSNLVYFYCETGTHTLVVSSYAEGAPPLLTDTPIEKIRAFEERLPACGVCGSRFLYYNPLCCPACHAPYIDFRRFPGQRKGEYYGNYLYGQTLQQLELTSAG